MSPDRSASTAASRAPAGHGTVARTDGPSRRARADRPVPAAACHAAIEATGEVSTAAISHTDAPARGRQVVTGTPGSHDPSGSATASTTSVWLATSTFGTSMRSAHARIGFLCRPSWTRGAEYYRFAKRTRLRPYLLSPGSFSHLFT